MPVHCFTNMFIISKIKKWWRARNAGRRQEEDGMRPDHREDGSLQVRLQCRRPTQMSPRYHHVAIREDEAIHPSGRPTITVGPFQRRSGSATYPHRGHGSRVRGVDDSVRGSAGHIRVYPSVHPTPTSTRQEVRYSYRPHPCVDVRRQPCGNDIRPQWGLSRPNTGPVLQHDQYIHGHQPPAPVHGGSYYHHREPVHPHRNGLGTSSHVYPRYSHHDRGEVRARDACPPRTTPRSVRVRKSLRRDISTQTTPWRSTRDSATQTIDADMAVLPLSGSSSLQVSETVVSERPKKNVRVEPRKAPFPISPAMLKGVVLQKGGPRAMCGDVAMLPLSEPSPEQPKKSIRVEPHKPVPYIISPAMLKGVVLKKLNRQLC